MYLIDSLKPGGRAFALYSRAPITSAGAAPSPFADRLDANPHFRWHPALQAVTILAEWMA
ncbi:MAG: hypothetical protein ABWY27_10370 [Telluria sp.]